MEAYIEVDLQPDGKETTPEQDAGAWSCVRIAGEAFFVPNAVYKIKLEDRTTLEGRPTALSKLPEEDRATVLNLLQEYSKRAAETANIG